MSERVMKRALNAETIGLVLVFFAIQVLLYGMEAFLRGTQIRSLFWVCLAAALIGLWAGKSRASGLQTSVAMVVLGAVIVWILGAKIAEPMFTLAREFIEAGPQLFPEIQYRVNVDARELMAAWDVIANSSGALMDRWQTWSMSITENIRVNDALIRNMIWTFALWLLSAWIGWFAAKRNAMASLLPGAALLTVMMWSSERRVESLWAFVVIMLLLMGIWNYKSHASMWETRRVDYSDSIRYDMGQSILIVVVVVGLLAFITPSVSWRDVRDYLRELERERARAQQAETVKTPNPAARPYTPPQSSAVQPELPREHLLTAGFAQSRNIVMTIRTGELPPVVIQNLTTNAPRYYWRSVVYDRYVGGGWFTTSAPAQPFEANQPLIAGVLSGYKQLHLNVQMQRPEGRLYWSGMLFSADIPLAVDWRLRPQSNLFADQTDLLQADMFAARTEAVSYKADAFVPIPSIEQLRASPMEEYPEHIQNHYRSLPPTVPARVHQLANEITEGLENPYDKAKAIETYLRLNYPYDLEIDAPPEDKDVADYFLFDLKRGYCDYYATAMVVLARSSGLPARFVSGYASGDYDAPNAQYVVRELHAHSWAEVYFNDIGWVEFEPTANQPEIERQEAQTTPAQQNESDSRAKALLVELTRLQIAPIVIPFFILFVVVLLYFAVIEPVLFLRVAPAVAIEVLYKRLYRSGRPLAGERTRAETAHEFTARLIRQVQEVNMAFKRSPHRLQSDVEHLTGIYHSSLFRAHAVDTQDVKQALKLWARLRWLLFIEKIKHFLWRSTKSYMDRVNKQSN